MLRRAVGWGSASDEDHIVCVQIREVEILQQDAVIGVELDQGVVPARPGGTRRRLERREIGKPEGGDIELVADPRTTLEVDHRGGAAVIVEDEGIVALAARQPVEASGTVDRVVAGAGEDHVVGASAGQAVVANGPDLRRRAGEVAAEDDEAGAGGAAVG